MENETFPSVVPTVIVGVVRVRRGVEANPPQIRRKPRIDEKPFAVGHRCRPAPCPVVAEAGKILPRHGPDGIRHGHDLVLVVRPRENLFSRVVRYRVGENVGLAVFFPRKRELHRPVRVEVHRREAETVCRRSARRRGVLPMFGNFSLILPKIGKIPHDLVCIPIFFRHQAAHQCHARGFRLGEIRSAAPQHRTVGIADDGCSIFLRDFDGHDPRAVFPDRGGGSPPRRKFLPRGGPRPDILHERLVSRRDAAERVARNLPPLGQILRAQHNPVRRLLAECRRSRGKKRHGRPFCQCSAKCTRNAAASPVTRHSYLVS